MKKVRIWLSLLLVFATLSLGFAAEKADYATLRKFLSARMYGEAYNELLRQEISGMSLDKKLKDLKIDLLDRTSEKLEKQAKVSPNDPTIFTILADIAFQNGDFDRASMYASRAIENNGSPMVNYVFAKILFRKGNIDQAFDQMGKVLEAMPDSPLVFNDFQFLYSCKQYGVATAKKLTKDTSFLTRSTPIAYDEGEIEAPESPFANDPTKTANSPDFSDYNQNIAQKTSEPEENSGFDYSTSDSDVFDDLSELAKTSDRPLPSSTKPVKELSIKKDTKVASKTPKKEDPLPDEIPGSGDFGDDSFDMPEEKVVSKTKKKAETEEPEVDPEKAKIEEAEKLLASARTKFRDGYLEDALGNIKRINSIYPNLPGKEEVEDKIKYEMSILKRYKEVVNIHQDINNYSNEERYDKSLKTFLEAYNYKPKLFPEAPYFIGKCYLLKEDPDTQQTLKYFDLIIEDPNLRPEIKRDILWTKLEIFYYDERYQEANELYNYFMNHEKAFADQQPTARGFYYGLWWHLYKTWLIVGISVFFGAIFFVFVLSFMPDLALIGGKPIDNARKAFETGKYDKAVSIGEKFLSTKQPIQTDREMREILVQVYYELGEYEKSQLHARAILKGFPTNTIAFTYLWKVNVALQDTSDEAIKMYEDTYRSDPSKRDDVLPILAHHYAKIQDYSPAAMEVMQDYHNAAPQDPEIIIGLAEGYVKNRTMNEDIVQILGEAIDIKDKVEYRELLARTFSKCGLYQEAARECINVLERNINNVGIHVVYTSSMKKLKMIPQAIEQYKAFIAKNPGNTQIIEIMNGLKGEVGDTSTLVDDVPKLSDELGMPGMEDEQPFGGDSITDAEVANFVEPPPEGFEMEQPQKAVSVPVPDFIQGSEDDSQTTASNESSMDLDGIQMMDPFADPDSDNLFAGFDTDELPEELGGTARPPIESEKSLDSLIDSYATETPEEPQQEPSAEESFDVAPKSGILAMGAKIEEAKDLAVAKKWDEVIKVLSPEFASDRNREAGLLLIEAWLGQNKPEMALEIIQSLDIDPEMMSDHIKEIMYRTANALEMSKKYSEALHLYDIICNADINYKDAFDRSDRLYLKMKS